MKKFKKQRIFGTLMMALAIVVALPSIANAHCDTMDGPTAADGIKAMEKSNINYALKWVKPEYEKELSQIFDKTMKVKELSSDAKDISQKYFLENLVRIHREGEGASFTGLKPSGTHINEKVLAADKSIEDNDLSSLEKLMEENQLPELREKFKKAISLKNYDINDVESGRKYIEAYVSYFKFAEGEEAHDAHPAAETSEESHEETTSSPIIPWSLAIAFFTTTLIACICYHKKASK